MKTCNYDKNQIQYIAKLRKRKQLDMPSLFLSFILLTEEDLLLRPPSYRSSKTRSRWVGKVSQKCRPTFVPACNPCLQTSIGQILDGLNLQNFGLLWICCSTDQLAQKAQLRKSLRKNLRFGGAKSWAKVFTGKIVCNMWGFRCPSSWTAGEGVVQNLFESHQFGSEIQQSIAR